MTQSLPSRKDSTPTSTQQRGFRFKPLDAPEVIRAFTPIVIALIGGAIGISVLFQENVNESAFGLASTAIAGAAGLAQPQKEKDE